MENSVTLPLSPVIRFLGLVEYHATWQAMKQFTSARTADTRDEIWLLQHHPVYTQGLAGKPEHVLSTNDIPIVRTDRGGQVTYHGPGQIVAYLLLDMRRWKLKVRELVRLMECAAINVLDEFNITAHGRDDAPGVYVGDAKIAALGLKIRNNYCYHGLALNVDMDLSPFTCINPCGHSGLQVTQAHQIGISASLAELEHHLARNLIALLQLHLEKRKNPHEQH